MATQPFPNPKFRAFDVNGDPLVNGSLYTYEAGTTTPLATYTTRAGDVANPNPVVLDDRGEADVWLTPGVLYKFELRDYSGALEWTVDNIPGGDTTSDATADVVTEPGGRLTLSSGTPVTTSDVLDATTLYYVSYKHDRVPLYDGAAWTLHTVETELSQATSDNTKSPAAAAATSCYDLFVWSDLGTLRLSRGPAWASDTSRGTGAGTTELERVDGRYVNKASISNGPAAQRGLYVGTVRTDSLAQVDDTMGKRWVWNMYNRVARPMAVIEPTADWAYTTATIRQARGSPVNQLDFVRGLNEDSVRAQVKAWAIGGVALPSMTLVGVGIGLDSTTAYAADCISETFSVDNLRAWPLRASWTGLPGIGRHYLAWLEVSQASGTTTWFGTSAASLAPVYNGISGEVWG